MSDLSRKCLYIVPTKYYADAPCIDSKQNKNLQVEYKMIHFFEKHQLASWNVWQTQVSVNFMHVSKKNSSSL